MLWFDYFCLQWCLTYIGQTWKCCVCAVITSNLNCIVCGGCFQLWEMRNEKWEVFKMCHIVQKLTQKLFSYIKRILYPAWQRTPQKWVMPLVMSQRALALPSVYCLPLVHSTLRLYQNFVPFQHERLAKWGLAWPLNQSHQTISLKM